MKRTEGLRQGSFEATATAEERTLARALDACGMPSMPAGTVDAIHRRVRAEATARRARVWRGVWAVAAAVALLLGVWAVRPGGDGDERVASAEEMAQEEETLYAEAEAEWLSPYADQFEELETTLLAFEAMDFDSGDTAFPSL